MKKKRPRHVVLGLLAGVFLGIGASVMVTIYGVARLDTEWPNVILILGIVLGLVLGLLPVRSRRQPSRSQVTRDASTPTP